ncbi:MAG: nuclease-related domain-containing protein, partial [Rhizobiaceae bacterium]
MSAHGIPDDPQFATESEREVWTRLKADGASDWTLLANVRLTDAKKDHELDVIVLMPDVGIVVVEVKGGDLRMEEGEWVVGHGKGRRVVHPVDQGRDGKYALRAYVERDPRWKASS